MNVSTAHNSINQTAVEKRGKKETKNKKERKDKNKNSQYIVLYICSDYGFIYTTENTLFLNLITHSSIKQWGLASRTYLNMERENVP